MGAKSVPAIGETNGKHQARRQLLGRRTRMLPLRHKPHHTAPPVQQARHSRHIHREDHRAHTRLESQPGQGPLRPVQETPMKIIRGELITIIATCKCGRTVTGKVTPGFGSMNTILLNFRHQTYRSGWLHKPDQDYCPSCARKRRKKWTPQSAS